MKNSLNALLLSAALTGLVGGTAASAQTTGTHQNSVNAATAGVRLVGQSTDKHSCKGKNDCKGKGGCKSSDNGCKGKNSCKGKGGCATDGSKMPKAV
ncbi:hypothetical protein ACFPT7_21010 [Acidicapsa dinghuensis]|uniref:Low-complexity protein n=1 Tax=Acidicapsa dinghuensis TaxID=2218256 RepID=A0ABW1EKJ8_9BACT|nr:hypothetical protein [Acidicapsa dinghuensis]